MFPRSEILIERESKAEFVLGRVESPGFQHTAVLLGCVEPSEAAPVANNYRNTAHTRRHIPIGGSVAGEGGVAHRSTQQFYWVAWSRAARDGFCGRGCDVLVSYRCSRDRKYLSRENRRLNLCLGGWSRLDSSTQRLCWVAWSPRGLHLLPTIIEIPQTLVDIYQSGALLLVRVESPIAAHSSSTGWRGVALPGTVFCGRGCDVLVSYRCSRDRKYLPRENRRLNLCLGGWSRLDSSTQRLCWVVWSPRRLHLLPTIIEILHTLVDIYQSGALLLVRVESPIAAHSSSTGWRGVALPGTVFVDGGVMSSYRCSRDRKHLSREKKIGGAISCQHLLQHDNRRLILCLGGWSRLDSSTQQLCWVAWSPRRLHLLPTSNGIHFRLKLVLREWSRLDLSTQQFC